MCLVFLWHVSLEQIGGRVWRLTTSSDKLRVALSTASLNASLLSSCSCRNRESLAAGGISNLGKAFAMYTNSDNGRKTRKRMGDEKAHEQSLESPWTVWCSRGGTEGSLRLLTNTSSQDMNSQVTIVSVPSKYFPTTARNQLTVGEDIAFCFSAR
jgi:hypothetical protein